MAILGLTCFKVGEADNSRQRANSQREHLPGPRRSNRRASFFRNELLSVDWLVSLGTCGIPNPALTSGNDQGHMAEL